MFRNENFEIGNMLFPRQLGFRCAVVPLLGRAPATEEQIRFYTFRVCIFVEETERRERKVLRGATNLLLQNRTKAPRALRVCSLFARGPPA